eukprot:1825436-Amphidinium_carterae.1
MRWNCVNRQMRRPRGCGQSTTRVTKTRMAFLGQSGRTSLEARWPCTSRPGEHMERLHCWSGFVFTGTLGAGPSEEEKTIDEKSISENFVKILRDRCGDLNRLCLELAVGKFGDGSPFEMMTVEEARMLWFKRQQAIGLACVP